MADYSGNQNNQFLPLPDEQILNEITVMETKSGKSRKILGVILVILGIGLIFTILLAIVGIILIIVGGYFIIRRKVKEVDSGTRYVLTNQRALVTEIKDGMNIIVSSCSLFDTTPTIPAMRTVTDDTVISQGNNTTTHHTEQMERGDLLFMKNGKVEVAFYGVPSPKDMLNTVEAIIRSKVG